MAAWNFGVLIAAIFMMMSDTGVITTILLAVAFVMMLINVIILPLKTGRTLGHFVSRIKYVNSAGVKSNPSFKKLHEHVVKFTYRK